MTALANIRERLTSYRFSVAVRPLRDPLVRMIARRVGHTADAEDIVQTALIRAYAAWKEEGREAFTAFPFWLRLVAFNAMKDHFRSLKAANDETFDPSSNEHVRSTGAAPSALDECIAREREQVFARAVAQLPEELRHVLIMREVELMSIDDIASALAIGRTTAFYRQERARRAVLAQMEE